jgi:hypothetical protein
MLAACVPDIDVDLALVDAPQIIALRSEPAEAEPGAEVSLTALFADRDGVLAEGPDSWSLCLARRPLAELGPIARACLDEGGEALVALGGGETVIATVPDDTCRRFGPDPPEAAPGEPTGRPVDPDLTGGYYQPVVVRDPAAIELALLQLRIACGVASATQEQAAELRRRYQPNRAPAPIAVLRVDRERELELPATATVAAGEHVALRVRWRDCPEAPECGDGLCTLDEDVAACPDECATELGCDGAESYLRFDPLALALDTARESIGIAWYATAGHFDEARTGRASDERESFGDNGWTAPDHAGRSTLWIVLRDDRGGVAWREQTIEVTR